MNTRIRQAVRELSAYVPGEQPRDPQLIKLNTNENPYPPSPGVKRVLADFSVDRLRRYPNPVCEPLCRRIASQIGCSTDQVFVGNGSDEILALCTRAFVEDDQSIGYFTPSYSLYPVLADIRVARTCPLPLGDDFTWPTDAVSGLLAKDPQDCSLFFITNPNAPSGRLYEKQVIAEFCSAFAGVVLVDEAYVDFADEDCMELALACPNVIVSRSLSKSYSLAGLRIGYAVGPRDLIEALFKIKDSYNVNTLCQDLADAALADTETMQENVGRVRATRERLAKSLLDLDFELIPSQANFIWARPPGIPAKELFEELRKRHILIRFFDGKQTGEYVRITIGTDEDIDCLLKAVIEILKTAQ